ncbi:competence type IV pilus ATPase ComGA [Lederbergia citrea]|uniref:competence type IV pilus ATPase ComGA n=1 Tax=Lederbergia citrea TaxID=2833581 RepID=UPI001BCA3BAD|nr:competence type IV pilus ATPase ComGA [Lederbergia citrea]MBS4176350.1 type II/IV secretion system protein [Lederbergia citrea]
MSIEKTADLLLSQALHFEASDIHITPRSKDYLVQFRIHGLLSPIKKIPPKLGERLISHLKFLASMDISEKRKPQSGSLQSYFAGKYTSLRISSLPTARAKESIVIRILPQTKALPHNKLALFPANTNLLTQLMVQAHGMIIFTGPTGSGKTSTMYSLAEYCSVNINRHVVTLEDPVEKKSDLLQQVQVNEKAGLSFSTGLKAILRHDPDIILIGEIRDAETAKIAIRAAMTGHLVLSSLHTRDAKGAIFRLLEFGVKYHELEQTLLAITPQRLVSIICPFCGPVCSKYCSSLSHAKRRGVLEILHGSALRKAIENVNGGGEISRYTTLQNLIRKGIALGYLSHEEYERWIIEQ